MLRCVGRSHVAPLDLVGGGGRENVHREGDLEQDVALVPVDRRVEVEARAVVRQRDALRVGAVQDAAVDLERGAQRAGLDHA